MDNIEIEFLNPVWVKINRQYIPIAEKLLSYPDFIFRTVYDEKQKRYRKKRQDFYASFVNKEGIFPAGLVSRILKNYKISLTNPFMNIQEQKSLVEPKDIVLREDQTRIVKQCLQDKRGMIESPTGSGKTVLAASLIHSFKVPTIFLVHTVTLRQQTYSEFQRLGLDPLLYAGNSQSLEKGHPTYISTIQTFCKAQDFSPFDMVIVDEVHHVSSKDTVYYKTLSQMPAIYRFGFTATIPKDLKHLMSMEAMIGPVIGKFSLEEGIDKGILAKPKIKLLKSTFSQDVKDLKKYQEVYQAGIIRNYSRNSLIMHEIKNLSEQNKTSLIIVNKIEHGLLLEKIGKRLNLKIEFVQGKTSGEDREILRNRLHNKELDCVIATTVWKEGVNIPSLDCIVNAGGGKSEIAVLQNIGRGLRTTENKTEVTVIDIFDQSHHYLINHFGERICLYLEKGWM